MDRLAGYRSLTIGAGIRAAAARGLAHPAIESALGTLTYGELVERIAKVAAIGRERYGLSRGDRIALIAANCPQYVELVAGLSDLGATVATLNPRLTEAELAAIVADCVPRLVVLDATSDKLSGKWNAKGIPTLTLGAEYEALLARTAPASALPEIDETDAFALAYTSGTTGLPKGVLLSHRSRVLTFQSMAAEYRCFGPEDRFLALAPMCHGAGFVFACAPLFFGGTAVLFEGDAEAILARIARCDITGVFMVPTHFTRIRELPGAVLDRYRQHRLTSIISNAAALPQALKESAIAQFGSGLLHETYGSTEAGIVTNIRPGDLLRKPGSVGLPFPLMEIELRRDDGTIAAPGEPGELFCRGPTLFNGYWRQPEATAEVFSDGWVTVGDVASRDADGFLTIVDRKKDMVVTGGVNVYPREVENVIAQVPGVREVAVVGRPSVEWGESLHAFVVASAEQRPERDTILAACRGRLAAFKVPKDVSFIGELPRNAGGKVLKGVLREVAAG